MFKETWNLYDLQAYRLKRHGEREKYMPGIPTSPQLLCSNQLINWNIWTLKMKWRLIYILSWIILYHLVFFPLGYLVICKLQIIPPLTWFLFEEVYEYYTKKKKKEVYEYLSPLSFIVKGFLFSLEWDFQWHLPSFFKYISTFGFEWKLFTGPIFISYTQLFYLLWTLHIPSYFSFS